MIKSRLFWSLLLGVVGLVATLCWWQWNSDAQWQPQPSVAAPGISALDSAEAASRHQEESSRPSLPLRSDVGEVKLSLGAVPEDAREEVRAFRAWAVNFIEKPDFDKAGMMEDGKILAKAHRQALKQIIMVDPRGALEQAVPMVLRQRLPEEVLSLLEERLSGVGTLDVLAVSPDSDPAEPPIRRVAILKGRYFRAHTYGQRSAQRSTEGAMLNGVAVDNHFAVNESPVRPLELGERPDPAKPAVETCPVSQKTTTVDRREDEPTPVITTETPAIEAGDQIIYLCDGGHIRQIEQDQLAAEGATGGPTSPTGGFPITRQFSTGIRKFLYMRVVFPDRLQELQSEKEAYANIKSLTDYFQEISYGKLTFLGTVAPLIVAPRSAAWYIDDFVTAGASYSLMNDAKEVARSLGFPPEDYHHFVVIYSGGPGSFGGQGNVNGPNTWLKSTSVGTFQHEFGHNIGVWHSNFWNTSGASVIGPGGNLEYGHTNDVMGSSGSNGHFNASMKEQLQWILPENYHTVLQNGTYRLFQFDQVNQDPARRYALKVAKDADRDYWLEFRQKLTTNPWFTNGISFNWSPWGTGGGNTNGTTQGSNLGTQLLDMTVGSPDDRNDAPLTIGRTFSDAEADVHVTAIGKGGTTPESIDVVVNSGTMAAGNQPPTLTLAADFLSIAIGGTVNLTATATDPEGDTLAYFWDFGDKLASYNSSSFSTNNLASQAKTYPTAGFYTVKCTVSDRKGGALTKTLLIQVGSPSIYALSGTVTSAGNPVANVRVHNGATGASYRGAVTDSDGIYQITNVAAGSVTLSTSLAGFIFTPSFTNPRSVSASQTNLDFTATESSRVSISAPASFAVESGSTGILRLSRTGDTSSALTVYVDFSGSASSSDYTLSPVAVTTSSPLESFTIAAGSAFLDITVTATNDSSQEGPEQLVMSLINGSSSYLPAGPQTVSLTIDDDDTTKPRLNLAISDPEATENVPADTAALVISRTGDTTSPLTVTFTADATPGNATAGTDYVTIGTTLVIPAGASSAPLIITPTNDAVVEGMELVKITLATSTNYVLPSPAPTGTIKINDDDTPLVTITATDPTANENGDLGQFTITRTGDLSSPLLVHYGISGDALHGTDYLALSGFVNFRPGSATATVQLIPYQDTHGEPLQNVILQLRSATNYVIGNPSKATVNITDDADLPVVAVGVSDGLVSEGTTPGTGKFKFTTTGTGTGNITVNFTVTGTAQSGVDFTALTGSLSIEKNTTSEITVTPLNDSVLEDAETLVLTIQPSASYTVDLQSAVTMVITDDDAQYMVTASTNTLSVTEGATAKFYLSRSGSTTSDLTVAYAVSGSATSGSDYTALTGTAVIPATKAGVYLDVVTVNDSAPEGTETVVLNVLPDPSATPVYGIQSGMATLPITDNDSGFSSAFAFAQDSTMVFESSGVATITVNRTGGSGACTVEYGVQGGTALGFGVDYALQAGVLSFAAGEMSKTFLVTLIDDGVAEDLETIVVQLRNANAASIGTASQHTFMIQDNEPRVVIEATDPFAYEGGADNAMLTFTRQGSTNGALIIPITVSGSATSGLDFTALPGSVTIPNGAASTTLNIAGLNDAFIESPESIIVSLAGSTSSLPGTTSSALVELGDAQSDDPPFVRIISPKGSSPGVPSGVGLILKALYTDDGLPQDLSLDWSKLTGPGTVTFTTPTQATTGATFSANGTYTLRARATDVSVSSHADVTFTVGAAVTPWTPVNIGSVGLNGSGLEQHGLHAINGAGSSLTGTGDSFFFRHRRLTGDGEIIARVRQVQNTSTSARAGIMLRESTASGSRMAAMLLAPGAGNLSSFNYRAGTGGSVGTFTTTGITPGYWVRLTRLGNVFTAYDSPDGVFWTQRGTPQTLAMPTDVLAGIAVCSATTSKLNHALVDNVRIIGTPDNTGPGLLATSPAGAVLNVPHPLDGTSSDDTLPSWPGTLTTEWSQITGPGSATFTNAAAIDTAATMPVPGTYTYQLTASDSEVQTYVQTTVSVQLPVVTLSVNDPNATELGLHNGAFTVSRTGGTGAPLGVKILTTGSATPNEDYFNWPASFSIPQGSASIVVPVSPKADSLAEGAETISLALQADAAYSLGTPVNGTVTIDDLPMDQWKIQEFGSIAAANNPALSGDETDWENDGWNTLLEYALKLDPETANSSGQPVFTKSGNTCSLTYTRVIAAIDLTYTVQWSASLESDDWSNAGVTEQVLGSDGIVQTIKASKTFAVPPDWCFMRLKVTR